MVEARINSIVTPLAPKRSCRDCQQFQLSNQGPRCRFRGGRPRGICAVFKRQPLNSRL